MLFSSRLFGRRIDWILATVALAIVAVTAMAWTRRPFPFDREQWLEGAMMMSPNNPRWRMRANARMKVRSGMSRDEVRTLMGSPDPLQFPGSSFADDDTSWLYVVGMEVDSKGQKIVHCLQVMFSPSDVVLETRWSAFNRRHVLNPVP